MTIRSDRGPGSLVELNQDAERLRVLLSVPFLDLSTEGNVDAFGLMVPQMAGAGAAMLVVDAYLQDNPVHPGGHLGWWTFSVAPTRTARVAVRLTDSGITVTSEDLTAEASWVNPQTVDPSGRATLVLHVVIRHRVNNAILSAQSLTAYRDGAARDKGRELARTYLQAPSGASFLAPAFNWPQSSVIHIVSRHLPRADRLAGYPDAVMAARLLKASGLPCRLYGADYDPQLRDTVQDVRELIDLVQPQDIVLFLSEGLDKALGWIADLPCRKAFIQLGFPSTTRLLAFDAEACQMIESARKAIASAGAFDLVIAATIEAAQELRAAGIEPHILRSPTTTRGEAVVTRLLDRMDLWNGVKATAAPEGQYPLLLCPAPLVPGSKLIDVLMLFEVVAKHLPGANLHLASPIVTPVYSDYLISQLKTRFVALADRVHLHAGIPDGRFKALMQSCDAMLHLGPVRDSTVADAAIFGRRLFVQGGDIRPEQREPGLFRLYGDLDQQAAAISRMFDAEATPAPLPPHSEGTGPAREPPWLHVIEALLALPRKAERNSFEKRSP